MRVKALLNSCIKATPCSARSLTTFTDWAFFWLVLYVSWRSHSLESRLQELFWQAKDLKKSHCRCCDEIVKSLCCRDDKWWVPFGRFLGSFIFFQHQNHQSLLFNWNFIIEKSKSHQQQKDTTRDVPVPSAAMAAFATSFCGYADSEHSMAKSFLGAAVGDWLWNQYLTYTAVTKRHTSFRWLQIWSLNERPRDFRTVFPGCRGSYWLRNSHIWMKYIALPIQRARWIAPGYWKRVPHGEAPPRKTLSVVRVERSMSETARRTSKGRKMGAWCICNT